MTGPEQMVDRYRQVRDRVAAACVRAGRSPDRVSVVAVSKGHPVETLLRAVEAGIVDLGENRPQELAAKHAEMTARQDHSDGPGARFHMIGQVQRNKAAVVARCADVVHSVDSVRLATALSRRATGAARTLDVLIQVNISGESNKSGCASEAAADLAAEAASLPGLRVRGFMGMAAIAAPDVVRGQFRRLADLASNTPLSSESEAPWLSMGMSGDYEIAVEEGATIVRIGSAIFGPRPAPAAG